MTINEATAIAAKYLDGATLLHSMRVMHTVSESALSRDLRCAALLHDVLESSPTIPFSPFETGYDSESDVWKLVGILTRRTDETYTEYIYRVAEDEDATAIKTADIEDNLYGRPEPPKESLRERYVSALDILWG